MIERTTIESVIGKTFADRYFTQPVIDASPDLTFSRRQLMDMGCGNFHAAATLNRKLKRLKVQTPDQLHSIPPVDLTRLKHVGEAAIYVAMCILDEHGYDVEKWWGWGQEDEDHMVKFSTYKHRVVRRAKKRTNGNGYHDV